MSNAIRANSTSVDTQSNDYADSYENRPIDEYVTDMANDPWNEDGYEYDNAESQSPVLSTREYEKELRNLVKQIRTDHSLSASDKKPVLDRINKLLHSLQKLPNDEVPPPEVLSEIEGFQMDLLDQQAQAMEESNAQSEEVYNQLGDLRGNVEGAEDAPSSFSLTDEQRKDTLTQIDQMIHSLDLGEKPENVSKKLETLQTKLNESIVDEKTQTFINLFTDPQVSAQDLKDAKIFDEIKNNHGEMPSDQVIQFIAEHDSTLKGLVTNEDHAGILERMGGLLNEGFGIEVATPDEEVAKDYGLKNQNNLLTVGSKVYSINISAGQIQIKSAEKMKEADLAAENIAQNLADISGMNDIKAEDILAKAKEAGINLGDLPPTPNKELFSFLLTIDPKLKQAADQFINNTTSVEYPTYTPSIQPNGLGTTTSGTQPQQASTYTLTQTDDSYFAAIRDRFAKDLGVLYPDAKVDIAQGNGNSSDNIIFNGMEIDVINDDYSSQLDQVQADPSLLFNWRT